MLAQRELRNNSTHTGAAYREHLHCTLSITECCGSKWKDLDNQIFFLSLLFDQHCFLPSGDFIQFPHPNIWQSSWKPQLDPPLPCPFSYLQQWLFSSHSWLVAQCCVHGSIQTMKLAQHKHPNLPGCPSLTDSEVKRKVLPSADMFFVLDRREEEDRVVDTAGAMLMLGSTTNNNTS